jgi:hypothetical protein
MDGYPGDSAGYFPEVGDILVNSRTCFFLILALGFGAMGYTTTAAARDSSVLFDVKGDVAGVDLVVGSAFDEEGIQLNDAGKELLSQFMQRIGLSPTAQVSIRGYADSAAAAQNDDRQSYGRALEVKASLLTLGFPREGIASLAGMKSTAADEDEGGGSESPQKGMVQVRVMGTTPAPGGGSARPETLTASSVLAAEVAQTQVAPGRFALGLGYPDVRARVALGYGVNLDAKFAFEQGIQVYSGRLAWNFYDLGPFKTMVGAEGGYALFNGVDSLNGNAVVFEGFLGLEYPFARRLRLSVDAGLASIQASSMGSTDTTTDIIYNTALYIYLF